MAFDWEAFSKGIGRTGEMISGELLRRHQEEREFKRQEKMLKYQADLELEINKDLAEYRQKLQFQGAKDLAEYQSQLQAFGGDPEFMKWVQDWTGSNTGIPQYDVVRQGMGMKVFDTWQRMIAGEEISPEDMEVFKYLPQQAQATIARSKYEYDLKRQENARLQQQVDSTAAYNQAHAEYFAAMAAKIEAGEPGDPVDYLELSRKRADAASKLADLINSPEYIMMAKKAEAGKLTPQEAQRWRALQLSEDSYSRWIMIADAMMGIQGQRQEVPPEVEAEEVEAPGLTQALMEQAAAGETLVPRTVQPIMGQVYEAGKEMVAGVKKELQPKLREIAKKKGIDTKDIIDLEKYKSIKDWAKGKTEQEILGQIIFVNGKLYKIIKKKDGMIGAEEI